MDFALLPSHVTVDEMNPLGTLRIQRKWLHGPGQPTNQPYEYVTDI